MNRRRLDFESMRDGILLKCGQLDQAAIGGPSENLTGKERSHRRSLYAFIDRPKLTESVPRFRRRLTRYPCATHATKQQFRNKHCF